jgi:hypothetical protein
LYRDFPPASLGITGQLIAETTPNKLGPVAESQYQLADYIFLAVEAVKGEGISTC